MYGILGGMGPLAGVGLMRRIVELTPASIDQAHIPLIAYSAPQIPDRSTAILHNGPSPLPAISRGVKTLSDAGAKEIAIACCTAHHWHPELSAASEVHILHVADALQAELQARGLRHARVGVLATAGALQSGFFQDRLRRLGHEPLTLSQRQLDTLFDPGVALIKDGRLEAGGGLAKAAAEALFAQGADLVILGCSELGLVFGDRSERVIDAMDALARLCVARWWRPLEGARMPQSAAHAEGLGTVS
jgi:aspartate racemase